MLKFNIWFKGCGGVGEKNVVRPSSGTQYKKCCCVNVMISEFVNVIMLK